MKNLITMLKFSRILPFVLATFLLALFTTACNNEDVLPEDQMEQLNNNPNRFLETVNARSSTSSATDSMDIFCFTIAYPITIQFPDGSSQAVNSDEELGTAVEIWYTNNPDAEEDPTLIFPISVTLADSTSQTINDDEALYELLLDCYGGEDWEDDTDWDAESAECFDLLYPFSVTTETGTTVINDEAAFTTFLEGLGEHEVFSFVYPLDIYVHADSISQTINAETELDSLLENCFNDLDWSDDDWDEDDDFGCIEPIYPFSVSTSAGVTLINSEDELEALLETLGEDAELEFIFPIDVFVYADSLVQTVNDEAQLEGLLEDCYGDYDGNDDEWGGEDNFDCFTLDFPFTVVTEAGSTTINNEAEFNAFLATLEEEEEPDFEFAYPLSVTLTADSTQQVINNEDEFEDLLSDCFEDWGEDEECFDFNYPIQLTTAAGTTTINSDEEFAAFCAGLAEDEDFAFVFPLNITLADGTVQTINDEEALYAAGEDCLD